MLPPDEPNTAARRDVKAPELVLASTSPYRRALLERLGIPFRCRAPWFDEDDLKDGTLPPRELAERLARAKAESLREAEPEAAVIGGDQLVDFQGRVFGKPGSVEGAFGQLLEMSGRSHALVTALAVAHAGECFVHTDVTTLHMRRLDVEEIARYVDADRPLDCAGSYKIEERGICLFERIETADFTAIMGLPLIALSSILRRIGFPVP